MVENGEIRKDLKGRYGPDVSCDYALDFIERHKTEPFLVYFPMALVHSPFVPTPDSEDWDKPKHKNNTKYEILRGYGCLYGQNRRAYSKQAG